MSYDLVVFEAKEAPRELGAFETWYQNKAEAAEETDNSLQSPATAAFRAFYDEMVRTFPDMNGPSGEELEEGEHLTGYQFQPDHIYIDFRWSVSSEAATKTLELAQKYGLGLYDLNNVVIYPEDDPNAAAPQSPRRSSFISSVRRLFGR